MLYFYKVAALLLAATFIVAASYLHWRRTKR